MGLQLRCRVSQNSGLVELIIAAACGSASFSSLHTLSQSHRLSLLHPLGPPGTVPFAVPHLPLGVHAMHRVGRHAVHVIIQYLAVAKVSHL